MTLMLCMVLQVIQADCVTIRTAGFHFADAVCEYYAIDELDELCSLFDTRLEYGNGSTKSLCLRFAKRLIGEMELGNNRRILEAILPSLFVRCSEMVSKTDWERRDFHQEMSARLEKLRPLLTAQPSPTEISVPDGQPFTAKSEIRDLVAKAAQFFFCKMFEHLN